MHDLLQIASFPALAQALIDAEFCCHAPADLDRDEALRQRVRGIITRSSFEVSARTIARLPNLGIVAVCGVGYERIALDAAAQRGVQVTHTPEILNSAVAELCIGMLFALLRRLPQADRYVRTGEWSRASFPLASNLAGKRVGIVGLGRIGKEIARRLGPFGVTLSYHGRSDQRLPWRYEPDLHALARASDVLILASPGGASTPRMIDASVLEALGASGFLINIARGSVVDEDALIDALTRRTIAGAALDVFDREPEIDARFLALDNVVLTPHIGSATDETRLAMARLTLDNLHRYYEHGSVLTPIDAPAAARSTRTPPPTATGA